MSEPGRNDPCWCGSGMKYKKCCGSATADAELDRLYRDDLAQGQANLRAMGEPAAFPPKTD